MRISTDWLADFVAGAPPPELPRLDGAIAVDERLYARLARRAARTHVPESAESRARGAGAGGSGRDRPNPARQAR